MGKCTIDKWYGSGIRNSTEEPQFHALSSAKLNQPNNLPKVAHGTSRHTTQLTPSSGSRTPQIRSLFVGLDTKKSIGFRLKNQPCSGCFCWGGWYFILEWFLEPKTSNYIVSPNKSLCFVLFCRESLGDQKNEHDFWCKVYQITAVASGNGNQRFVFICKSYGGFFFYLVTSTYLKTHQGPNICHAQNNVQLFASWVRRKITMKLGAFKPETPEVLKKISSKEKWQMRPFCFSTKASFWGRWASSNINREMAKVLLPDQLKSHTPSARRIFDEDDLQFWARSFFSPMDWMNLCQRWCCSC